MREQKFPPNELTKRNEITQDNQQKKEKPNKNLNYSDQNLSQFLNRKGPSSISTLNKQKTDAVVQTIQRSISHLSSSKDNRFKDSIFKPKTNKQVNRMLLEKKKEKVSNENVHSKCTKISIKFSKESLKSSFSKSPNIKKSSTISHETHRKLCKSMDFSFIPSIDSKSIEMDKKAGRENSIPRWKELSKPIEKKLPIKDTTPDIECTFSPEIHQKVNSIPVVQRLSEWETKKIDKIKAKGESVKEIEFAQCTSSQKLISL